MSRLVQVHQRASHVLPPSATALCAGLWARTLMTTRYLPAVDVQGPALPASRSVAAPASRAASARRRQRQRGCAAAGR